MRDRTFGLVAVITLGIAAVGCASRSPVAQATQPAARVATPPAQAANVAPVSPADPIADLIALSNRHFESGQRELAEGHLEMAKTQFDRALEVILESPTGVRGDVRLREQFERLVDRISAYEVTALAKGDGFTEKKYEPAT